MTSSQWARNRVPQHFWDRVWTHKFGIFVHFHSVSTGIVFLFLYTTFLLQAASQSLSVVSLHTFLFSIFSYSIITILLCPPKKSLHNMNRAPVVFARTCWHTPSRAWCIYSIVCPGWCVNRISNSCSKRTEWRLHKTVMYINKQVLKPHDITDVVFW